MPIIEITLAEGRSEDDLRRLMQDVHDTVHRSIGAPEASIRVLVRQIAPELWLAGGETLAERARR
ncbi:tautomerase family protein [Sinomonas sp. JGH33]|uniref:Tautomerase family protein n=1 Tax=Sinomonas terricola TaxID=3110330 RepID=A0ABU5TBF9_9MICC|nr:tautomerase family protein [Sinomonas sp. JGH33]MEA5457027.1 tautomerase family protein [Sinomonas sp. JGH33]